jgi:DNA-binding MurR/RpiR family transcriptional regulator
MASTPEELTPAAAEKPATMEAFRQMLSNDRDRFTRRMLEAASYALENPHEVALNPVSVIAERSGLAATTFVRLTQAMGFSGFTEMQRLFRHPLQKSFPTPLHERIRHSQGEQVIPDPNNPVDLGRSFASANIASLNNLADRLDTMPLQEAVEQVMSARMIYVIGVDRSFGPASYLSYALNRTGLQSVQILGLGSAIEDHAAVMAPGDLLLAISFPPYAADTISVCRVTREKGNKILAITDSSVSPITEGAVVNLIVNDAELHGFRSLTALMTVIQRLMMAVAYRKRGSAEDFNIDKINA